MLASLRKKKNPLGGDRDVHVHTILPPEVMLRIFSHVAGGNGSNLNGARLVCWDWNNLCKDQSLPAPGDLGVWIQEGRFSVKQSEVRYQKGNTLWSTDPGWIFQQRFKYGTGTIISRVRVKEDLRPNDNNDEDQKNESGHTLHLNTKKEMWKFKPGNVTKLKIRHWVKEGVLCFLDEEEQCYLEVGLSVFLFTPKGRKVKLKGQPNYSDTGLNATSMCLYKDQLFVLPKLFQYLHGYR